MIGRHNCLALHKSEWDRLRRKPSSETINCRREEYFKALNEQSQKWTKLLTDSVQGHVHQLKYPRANEQDKLIRSMKEFAIKKKQYFNTVDAVKRAKELIFADSCYGRQLLSALLESRTLEERDLQLKFKKELTEKITSNDTKLNEPKGISLQDAKQMEIDETKNKLRREQTAKEVAKCNAAMVEMQKEKKLKEKEERKQQELEDVKLNNEYIKINADIESKVVYQEKQAIKEYEAENKRIKDFRAKREEQDELTREIWRKYKEKIRNREKKVLYKLHHEKYDLPQCQKVFRMIQNIEEYKNKKYDEFVQKGIERWLDRSNKREQKEMENRTSLRNERKLLDEENKFQAEFQNRRRVQENSKCACFRQCILPKCSAIVPTDAAPKKKGKWKSCIKNFRPICKRPFSCQPRKLDAPAPSFLQTKNKHVENLKARQLEPTPWTALKAAHDEFSQHASKTLQECRYKNAARKVIDDYRRINCLDSKSLPVFNY